MAEEIGFENGRNSNFQGLVTLTLDPAIRHTLVHHSSTSTYIPNFIQIEETFCGRTDGRTYGRTFSPSNIIRSTFGSRPKNESWNVWRPRLKSQNFCGHCRDQYRMHMSDHKCCRWKDLTVYNETWRTQGALPHCFTTLLQRFLLRFLSGDTIPRPQLMWSMLPVIRLTHNRSLYLVRWLPRLALATVELSVEQMFGDAISNFWRTWPHQWNRHSTLSYQLMWSMRHRQRIWNLLSVKM